MQKLLIFIVILLSILSCQTEHYDLIIRNGEIIDGSGLPGYYADMAMKNDTIALIAQDITGTSEIEIDAKNFVVSPGFIDILSWACGPILYDGEVQSVVRQGITTTIFGEGWSMGPVNQTVREEMEGFWPEYKIKYNWKTLADYLKIVERQGTSVNVASFVGATTVRMYVIGLEDRKATSMEMQEMCELVASAMEEGAFGLASSLVYTPAFYASTEELIELAKTAAKYGGIYISHIRGEGSDLISALNELITISESAQIPAEVYHFKAAGKENWSKLERAIALIDSARALGLDITADIYPYTAGATGLSAMIPPWAKEGGDQALLKRLIDPKIKQKIKDEILNSTEGWENFYRMSGGGKNILVSYLSADLKHFQGKNIAEIAKSLGKDEVETIFELLKAEKGGGGGIYFLMSEQNVQKKIRLPWISFCTDEDAYRPTGLMGNRSPHPRAYGTYPRILGKYVREEKILSLEDAIKKMTSMPALRLGLENRGILKEGNAADIVIFDPNIILDQATYISPHQFPSGIPYVIVNGKIVVKEGKHTGAKPGKALFKRH